jgi:hypothetical protein
MKTKSLIRGRMPAGMLLLIMITLVSGCRTYNVRSDWDPAISFERFQRFYWQEPPEREGADPFEDNSLMRKRVRFSIESALTERGYRAVESPADADFFVTYGVVLDDRLRVDGVNSGIGGFGIGARRRGGFGFYGGGINSTSVREYQESVLLIDFLNPADETLVWRGWGTGIVQTRDRERGQARLDDGVSKILNEFPPPYQAP